MSKVDGNIQEERAHPRVATDAEVLCERIGQDIAFKNTGVDISVGGIMVYSNELSEPGDRLMLRIKIEGHELTTKAMVRWIKNTADMGLSVGHNYALGLEFIETSKYYAAIIKKYIENNLVK